MREINHLLLKCDCKTHVHKCINPLKQAYLMESISKDTTEKALDYLDPIL